jgi:hypothetical protein
MNNPGRPLGITPGTFADTDAAIEDAGSRRPLSGADVIRMLDAEGEARDAEDDAESSESSESPSILLPMIAEAVMGIVGEEGEPPMGDSGHTSLGVAMRGGGAVELGEDDATDGDDSGAMADATWKVESPGDVDTWL